MLKETRQVGQDLLALGLLVEKLGDIIKGILENHAQRIKQLEHAVYGEV